MRTLCLVAVFAIINTRGSQGTECGSRPKHAEKAGGKRITGGQQSVPGGWPWMAGIFVQQQSKYFVCGATLVSDRYVLSAGHCGVSKQFVGMTRLEAPQVSVRLGMQNVSVKKKTEQEIPAKRLILNPKWAFITKNTTVGPKMITTSDMMLIELKYPAKLSKLVQPICMRKKPFKPGKMCYVAGWGTEKVGGPILGTLHEASIPIVHRDKCNKPKSYAGVIPEELVCAGFIKGGKDACEGDSGGPLMCEGEDKKWYIAGVASFGHHGCGLAHKYGIYGSTSAEKSRNWIQKTTSIHYF